jgi:hypothetical protein
MNEKQKKYLKKFSINITEIADFLDIKYHDASIIFEIVRYNHRMEYKSGLYGIKKINPRHLLEYITYTAGDLTKCNIENYKNYFKRFSLNILEVAECFSMKRYEAKLLCDTIREFYRKDYNSGIYRTNKVSPKHLANFIGIDQTEFINIVSAQN